MPKTFEQRIAYLEKIISDFFSGSQNKAKKAGRTIKRKVKNTRQSVGKRVSSRNTARKSRRS
jgi:hypothetical protein